MPEDINQAATDSSAGAQVSPSQAHIGTEPYTVDSHTPPAVKQFLEQSLSNNRYNSLEHLQDRAKNHLRYRDAERNILHATTEALKQPESAVFQQTAWMGHLERSLWYEESHFGGNDRAALAQEALGSVEPKSSSPFYGQRGLQLSDSARSAFSMMLHGAAGPFTIDEARAGFELAQTGQVLAGRLGITERKDYRISNRVDANRVDPKGSETHSTKTLGGMDLSQDLGTAIRDEVGLPVMSGTSGSSSDAAIAARFAAERLKARWAAPGLSDAQGRRAITDLSLHYFRADGSSPPESMAKGINRVRAEANLEPKKMDASGVFTHSYAEVHAGVALTLVGAGSTNEAEMRKATQEAKRWLDEADNQPAPAVSTTASPEPGHDNGQRNEQVAPVAAKQALGQVAPLLAAPPPVRRPVKSTEHALGLLP